MSHKTIQPTAKPEQKAKVLARRPILRRGLAGFTGPKKRGKPGFTAGQLVSSTDMQRKFKEKVEPALAEHPFVVVLTSAEPRHVILNYEVFESMWAELQELRLQNLALSRALRQAEAPKQLLTYDEVLSELGITAQDLEEGADVESEPD